MNDSASQMASNMTI